MEKNVGKHTLSSCIKNILKKISKKPKENKYKFCLSFISALVQTHDLKTWFPEKMHASHVLCLRVSAIIIRGFPDKKVAIKFQRLFCKTTMLKPSDKIFIR